MNKFALFISFENFLKISKRLNTPTILLLINESGLSIDLSTCVSAARLNIPIGFILFIIFSSFGLTISHLIKYNFYFFKFFNIIKI